MSWLDDLIGIGSGITSDLSPEQLVSAGSDSFWDPTSWGASSYEPSWFDNVAQLAAPSSTSSGNSDFYGLGATGTLSGPEAYFAGRDEVWAPTASSGGSSVWDSFNTGLQKIGDFTGSKGGQFLMGGLGGLASYLDAKKKNALMKQMMEQAAAEKAARAAKSAQYDAPARVTNTKSALPSWGAGSQAFSGNSLAAMTPRSSGTMYAAEGGSAEAPRKTSTLQAIKEMLGMDTRTTEQIKAEEAKKARQAGMTETQKFNANLAEDQKAQVIQVDKRARGGYIPGEAPGQSDKVPAMLSDGEFVMDADTVSALGDGNNAAGAGALEKMRQNIRKHKRAAPAHKIPPKAKKPEAYLKGAK